MTENTKKGLKKEDSDFQDVMRFLKDKTTPEVCKHCKKRRIFIKTWLYFKEKQILQLSQKIEKSCKMIDVEVFKKFLFQWG